MFGATVLGPIPMGFNPQAAVFFTGIGMIVLISTTHMKVPSYLGPSFAFVGPVLAVTGGDPSKVPFALCGISGTAVLVRICLQISRILLILARTHDSFKWDN